MGLEGPGPFLIPHGALVHTRRASRTGVDEPRTIKSEREATKGPGWGGLAGSGDRGAQACRAMWGGCGHLANQVQGEP